MATGVPKKKTSKSTQCIKLEYSGKKAEAEIKSYPPSKIHNIWRNHSNSSNALFFGENLGILSRLRKESTIAGKIKLIYIDPPFATQTAFHSRDLTHAYEDIVGGAEYIEALRERLVLLHDLLSDDGSIYLHLDDKMIFQMKIVLDEIFGAENYRNFIVRKKCNPKNYTRLKYGNISDYILYYTKSSQYTWNRPVEVWTEERAKEYQYVEPETGRRFMKVPVHAPGTRNGETGKKWRGMLPPPGKHWQYTPEKLDEMDARGEIFWSSNGNPRRKVYLDQSKGINVQDIWLDFRDAHNQNICITGYPTEKNPALLARIIESSSNPGDIVLDCYSGSGTTLAVAQSLERKWIGIDNSKEAISATLKRFSHGTKPMGDFVNGKKENKINNMMELPLFSQNININLDPSLSNAIDNFQFFSDTTNLHEAKRIAERWKNSLPIEEQETTRKAINSTATEDVLSAIF